MCFFILFYFLFVRGRKELCFREVKCGVAHFLVICIRGRPHLNRSFIIHEVPRSASSAQLAFPLRPSLLRLVCRKKCKRKSHRFISLPLRYPNESHQDILAVQPSLDVQRNLRSAPSLQRFPGPPTHRPPPSPTFPPLLNNAMHALHLLSGTDIRASLQIST